MSCDNLLLLRFIVRFLYVKSRSIYDDSSLERIINEKSLRRLLMKCKINLLQLRSYRFAKLLSTRRT